MRTPLPLLCPVLPVADHRSNQSQRLCALPENTKWRQGEISTDEAAEGHPIYVLGGLESRAFRCVLEKFRVTTQEQICVHDDESLYCEWMSFLIEKTH